MTQVQSNAFRVEIVEPGAFPPYPLPGSGQSLTIGTNNAESITPSNMTAGSWSYSLFNNFGGGAWVNSYSQGGAFVLAMTGGHGVPANVGAAIFDFQDATWKRRDPPASQGGATFYRNSDYSLGETTGAPAYLILGSNGVPAPAHTGQQCAEIPTSLGGGAKGSVCNMMRGSTLTTSISPSTGCTINLDTGLWTTGDDYSDQNYGSLGSFSAAALDVARARIWQLGTQMHIQDTVMYLDLNDLQLKQTAVGSVPVASCAAGSAFMHNGLLYRQGTPEGSGNFGPNCTLHCYNPDTRVWVQCTVSGPTSSGLQQYFYYPARNAFYTVDNNGQIYKLVPPASPPSGTWVGSIVTVTPALLGRTQAGVGGGFGDVGQPDHYNNCFYVPSIQRMAWIPGGNASVYLFNPP